MASASSSLDQDQALPPQNEPAKHCWICFANEDDDYSAQWVTPCKCRGTAKWVHKVCLQRWIDEKQHGKSSVEVACPQCNSSYIILYPNSGLFVRILDTLDRIICKACPFIAGGVLVGSVYWTAVTFGAITIMQVLGHKEGLNVMEKADPLIMLFGLPLIPLTLIGGRHIPWEDEVLRLWRKHSTKLPLVNLIFNPSGNSEYLPRVPAEAYGSSSDAVSLTRRICGGLILPTIATIVGKLMFHRINSNFQRSIIGGIAFIGLKGILKIYYKQQQFLRQAHRQIKNYDAGTSSSSTQTSSSSAPTQLINTNSLNGSISNHPQNNVNITRRYRQEINQRNIDSFVNHSSLQSHGNELGGAAAASSKPLNIDDISESRKVNSFAFRKSNLPDEQEARGSSSSCSSSASLTND